MRAPVVLAVIGCVWSGAMAHALDLPRAAVLAFEEVSPQDIYRLPIGPASDGDVPSTPKSGVITRRAWHIPQTDLTVAQAFDALRDQLSLVTAPRFECASVACGGFDFRFGIEVLDAPAMFVDLGAFRFASFDEGSTGAARSLLVSKGGDTLFVQLIEVGPDVAAPVALAPAVAPTPGLLASSLDVADKLAQAGATVLDDLEFATGAAELTDAVFASLDQLAAFLSETPEARIMLVGHTDATGSLDGNISLSKRRAEAVRDRLIAAYGVNGDQIAADGIGYLSPRSTNLTDAGRQLNRRVEAVLTAPLSLSDPPADQP